MTETAVITICNDQCYESERTYTFHTLFNALPTLATLVQDIITGSFFKTLS